MDETVFHPPHMGLVAGAGQPTRLEACSIHAHQSHFSNGGSQLFFWSDHDKVLVLPAGDSDIYLSHDLVFLIFGRLGWRFCS